MKLTYLNSSTTVVMMPVTNITIARTQKRPRHLVKSTYEEKHLIQCRLKMQR